MNIAEIIADPMMGFVSILLIVLGAGVAVFFTLIHHENWIQQTWHRYIHYLNSYMQFLFIERKGAKIAQVQLIGVCLFLVLYAIDGSIVFFLFSVGCVIAPVFFLKRKKRKRIASLEKQLNRWLMTFANALRASPAIGNAMEATIFLVEPPLSQEIDYIVKQHNLGMPIDKAILNSCERMESHIISSALNTIVIARQTGGDISKILERSAASLREIQHLEVLLRSKTAEAKGQLQILGVIPIPLFLVMSHVNPLWIDSLLHTTIGHLILAVSFILWFLSILVARLLISSAL